MRRISVFVLAVIALLLLGLSGCRSRLDYESTVTISPTGHAIEFGAPKSEQKVTITLSSPGAPVTAYLVLAKDKEATENAMQRHQKPEKALDGKERVEEATLNATIPANEEFVLLLSNATNKTAQVKVKATGR